jgi:hypothetical protein
LRGLIWPVFCWLSDRNGPVLWDRKAFHDASVMAYLLHIVVRKLSISHREARQQSPLALVAASNLLNLHAILWKTLFIWDFLNR